MDVQNKLYDEYIRLRGHRGQVDIAQVQNTKNDDLKKWYI